MIIRRFPVHVLLALPLLGGVSTPETLIEAVKQKNTAAAEALIDRGGDVNQQGADSATALHWAIHGDDLKTAKLLIGRGAQPGVSNRFGVQPLTLACINGSSGAVMLLLEAGANANARTPEGETALMTCSRSGNVEAVGALIEAGAEVNSKEDWRGQTALMWAAAEGHIEVVRALLAAGADVAGRSEQGFTALLFAARQGQQEVVETLLEGGADLTETLPGRTRRNWNESDEAPVPGPNALDLAVANAHYELAAALLESGADPDSMGQSWTPLHTITWVRKPGTGSNDPAPPGSGDLSSLDLVRLLVEKGADVNARFMSRRTPARSSLNFRGATPFLLAARTADVELMQLLLELGADPLLPNEDGSTPLMVAAGLGTRAPAEDPGTEEEALEAVKLTLALGGDVNAVDRNGETAMHGAAYKHVPSVARFLCDNGARVSVWNRKNSEGWTPLRIAVGVHRGMNFRSSPETAAVLRQAMASAGVSTEVDPEPVISGATQE